MRIKRSEFLIFLGGMLPLGGLLGYVFRGKNGETSAPASASPDVAFVLPESAVHVEYRFDGLTFAVDRARKRVRAFRKDGVLAWESDGEDRFIVPGAAFPLDVTPDGELWVANIGRKRLERLDPKTGRFIASWEPTTPFGGCCNPVRFAALSGGRFATMEKGTRQARVYLPSGDVESVLADDLSDSEFNYYLARSENGIDLYDTGRKRHWEVT